MLSVNVALVLTDTAGLGKLQHGVCVWSVVYVCGLCVICLSQQHHSNAFDFCMLEIALIISPQFYHDTHTIVSH